MHIESLELYNFQSHIKTKFVFDRNVNAIFGATNSGKSAIIRALKCLIFKGPFFLRRNESHGWIEMVTSNGDIIKRERKIRGTVISDSYILNGAKFTKFGRIVPEEIREILEMVEVDYGDGFNVNLNLQDQHDSKFLISNAYDGLDRTKITSIRGIKPVEQAMIQSAKDARGHGAALTQLEAKAVELESKILEYKDLDILESNTKSLIHRYDSIQKLNSTIVQLYGIRDQLESINTKYIEFNIPDISTIIQKIRILNLFKELLKYVKIQPKSIKVPNIGDIGMKLEIYSKLKKLFNLTKTNIVIDHNIKIQQLHDEYQILTKDINCPTCGQVFPCQP